jgi:hypothetical protein
VEALGNAKQSLSGKGDDAQLIYEPFTKRQNKTGALARNEQAGVGTLRLTLCQQQ